MKFEEKELLSLMSCLLMDFLLGQFEKNQLNGLLVSDIMQYCTKWLKENVKYEN